MLAILVLEDVLEDVLVLLELVLDELNVVELDDEELLALVDGPHPQQSMSCRPISQISKQVNDPVARSSLHENPWNVPGGNGRSHVCSV